MREYLDCYLGCIASSNFFVNSLIFVFIPISIIFSAIYIIKRESRSMIYGQGVATVTIWTNLAFMRDCDMFKLLWAYLAIVLVGILLLGGVKYHITKWVKETIATPAYINRLAKSFSIDISILGWPGVSAFTFRKKVYLTLGLLNRLKYNEIKAVVAHEAYHAHSNHNPTLASFIGITSLTFIRHKEEYKADEFAVKVAGYENLKKALRKLNVKDLKKRIEHASTIKK